MRAVRRFRHRKRQTPLALRCPKSGREGRSIPGGGAPNRALGCRPSSAGSREPDRRLSRPRRHHRGPVRIVLKHTAGQALQVVSDHDGLSPRDTLCLHLFGDSAENEELEHRSERSRCGGRIGVDRPALTGARHLGGRETDVGGDRGELALERCIDARLARSRQPRSYICGDRSRLEPPQSDRWRFDVGAQ